MSNGLTQKHNAKSLLLFAMPTIIMMVFMSLYTMVDGIFVANFVSAEALAGLNIVIPALSILVSVSVMISAGGSVVISRKLGEGKEKEAREEIVEVEKTDDPIAVTEGEDVDKPKRGRKKKA